MKHIEKEQVCQRLGLTIKAQSAAPYSPYFMDPFSLNYPQELKECGGGGDCFFKYETNENFSSYCSFLFSNVSL
jgi:hypothetical protein